ncbi:MAG: FHA domain-containing protein, partial [Verrucomicrobiota bacterium]
MTPLKTLLVTLPDQPTPSSIKLDKDAMKLGRHADINEIHVPVGPISSNHCEFIRQGETYALRDLDSTNGTRINGERITEPVALKDGDVILLGETITAKFLAKEEAKLYETPSVVAAAPRQPAPSPVAPVRTPAPGAPAPTVKLAPPTPTPGAPGQPTAPVAPQRNPRVPRPTPA